MAGTAAWPSDTVDTPATVSSACVRLAGWRFWISRDGSSVVALAIVASMSGAVPAVTVTVSSTSAEIRTSSGPSAGIASTRTGLVNRSPARMTMTSNGGVRSGFQEKRPSASV